MHRSTCFLLFQNRAIVFVCVSTQHPSPHSFPLHHPSANTESPALTEKTHSTSWDVQPPELQLVHCLYSWHTTLSHTVLQCVHSSPPCSQAHCTCIAFSRVWKAIECRCPQAIQMLQNYQLGTDSAELQGLNKVEQIKCFTLQRLIKCPHFIWEAWIV